jgi:DNA-binding transcriptional ArsR family regulator
MTPKAQTKADIDQRLVKALAHPLRVQALTILNERVASPKELAGELDVNVSHMSYHIKVLLGYDCLELVETKPRRGATEHFYRATTRAFLTTGDWLKLPASMRAGISASVLQSLFDDAAGAMQAGTFEAREDRHLSWTPVIVDEAGWKELTDELAGTLNRVLAIQAASAERMAQGEEPGRSVTVSILGYEAPSEPRKVSAPTRI